MVRAADFARRNGDVAGQWDAVNGEVLRCPAFQASMDRDDQLERHAMSDVKPFIHSGSY